MNGNAADFFVDRHVREGRGERIAFIDSQRSLSYAALAIESDRFAQGLLRVGLQRQSRIALLLLDSVDFPVAFWGAIRAGMVPIPINTMLPPELVAYILADSQAELVVVSEELVAALQATLEGAPGLGHIVTTGALDAFCPAAGLTPPVPCDPEDIAFWLYSSGSTNMPKGVQHKHASLRATVTGYGAQVLQLQPDDVVFSAAKMFFAYGLGNSMTFPMAVGASAILLPGRPTAAAVLELMATYRPNVLYSVPTLYAAMLNHAGFGAGAWSSRLRRCVSAGEALPAHIAAAWRALLGVEILDGIGSTEMLHIFLSNSDVSRRDGTSGVAVPGYELRIVDGEGRDQPAGEPGELLVKGASAAASYWNQPENTARSFVDGWVYTGDKYVCDADGFYTYRGRTDDMFKVSGIWVSPFEVEGVLASHPAVLEAAVVGREDADGLIKPRAFLRLKDGVIGSPELSQALQLLVKQQIGPWNYPRWIEFVEDLPKTATGKIQRFKLRQWA